MDWIDDKGAEGSGAIAVRRDGDGTYFWGRVALLADLRAHLASGVGFSLATLNLDHVVKLRSDAEFRAAYSAQSHVTADGNPIVWLERLAGREAELVPGSELVLPLARIAAELDCPVALVGSTPASLDGAANTLERAVPGLRVVARVAPPMGFDPVSQEAACIVDTLRAAGARLCLVALGAPRQERFAAFARDRMPEAGFACVGAGLDFLSGAQVRAPRLIQSMALEWLWRLATDPARLTRRYASCAILLPGLAMSALRVRRLTGNPAPGGT